MHDNDKDLHGTLSKKDPRAMSRFRHLIRVMRRHDLTKKKTMTKTNTKTKTMTKTNTKTKTNTVRVRKTDLLLVVKTLDEEALSKEEKS